MFSFQHFYFCHKMPILRSKVSKIVEGMVGENLFICYYGSHFLACLNQKVVLLALIKE